MNAGIEKINFYIPQFYIKTESIVANNVDVNVVNHKITAEQEKNAILPFNEDIITMGANAAYSIVNGIENEIDMIIFATESGIDYSKSAAISIHLMLNIKPSCICFDVKQACYGGMAALLIAKNYINQNLNSKVLIITSDIAMYENGSSAQITEGAGAVAMIISNKSDIIEFSDFNVNLTKNTNDFYRPNKNKFPIVNGLLSNKVYLEMMKESFFALNEKDKIEKNSLTIAHVPLYKLAYNGIKLLNNIYEIDFENSINSLIYNKNIGNIYNGSVFLALLSLINNTKQDLSSRTLYIYSYGSGSTSGVLKCKISKDVKSNLNITAYNEMLNNRIEVSYSDYLLNKKIECNDNMNENEMQNQILFSSNNDVFKIKEIKNGIRYYAKKLF